MEEEAAETGSVAAAGPTAGRGIAISRRAALRLAAAMLTLGRALGLPTKLAAEGHRARVELRYYRTPAHGDAKLLYAEPLASPVLEALSAGNISEIEMRWYDGRSDLLGSVRLPPELQQKLERLLSP